MNIPLKVVWYLTSACSEMCAGCPFANSPSMPGELTPTQAQDVLAQMSRLGIFSISYTGGEPTLRPDLLDLIAAGTKARMLQFLATNGHALDRRFVAQLSKLEVREVALSIASADAGRNDQVRGDGSYHAALTAGENCRSFKIPFSISTTVGDEDVEEIPELIKLVADIGAVSLRIQAKTIFTKEKAKKILSKASMAKLIQNIGLDNHGVNVKFGCSIGFLKFSMQGQAIDEKAYGLCDVGPHTLTLRSDGAVTTCVQLLPGSEVLGNVKDQSLQDIFMYPQQAIDHWFEKGDISKVTQKPCTSCNFLASCKGGCRGFTRISGNFFGADQDCPRELLYEVGK